uniref:Uncharacterized protein n=1 Tax=Romanomermis culicivorax TaxID=13658 RepID=A0A915J727_ROMCU
MKFLWAKCPA